MLQTNNHHQQQEESEVEYGVVTKEYLVKKEGELALQVNDVVCILAKPTTKWWLGQLKGVSGKIPSNHIKIIENISQGKRAKAMKEFKPDDHYQLTFKAGDIILVLPDKIPETGCSIGVHNHRQGVFPSDFVVFVEDLEAYYGQLAELLCNELSITAALCSSVPVTAADHVSKALINLFEAKGNTFNLLKVVIQEEARNTSNASTLFRSNSMASKLMSAYGRMTGQDYLHQTLRPLVKWIGASSTSFEIDPSKMVAGDLIEENRKNLMEGADLFFKGIRKSISACPLSFRAICYQLQEAVREKFPESVHSVVGGFFFLRFMCPAIISPEGFGVLTEGQVLVDDARRALVLVSKLLQNLANGKLFGSKEAYMVPMQDFITNHQEEIKLLFDELAQVNPEEIESSPILEVSAENLKEYLCYIHTQLALYQDQITERLKQRAISENKDLEDYEPIKRLKNLLNILGPPPDEKKQKHQVTNLSLQAQRKQTAGLLNMFFKRRKDHPQTGILREGERIKKAGKRESLRISSPIQFVSSHTSARESKKRESTLATTEESPRRNTTPVFEKNNSAPIFNYSELKRPSSVKTSTPRVTSTPHIAVPNSTHSSLPGPTTPPAPPLPGSKLAISSTATTTTTTSQSTEENGKEESKNSVLNSSEAQPEETDEDYEDVESEEESGDDDTDEGGFILTPIDCPTDSPRVPDLQSPELSPHASPPNSPRGSPEPEIPMKAASRSPRVKKASPKNYNRVTKIKKPKN